jgi:SAM-dependent methyltransferase
LLGDVREKTVLDLGCGSGENLIPLVKRGAHVIGIDLSPELIALARERLTQYGLAARLEVASAYDTGLENDSVDVVFSIALLHHLPDLARARREIQRMLRPGGCLIFQEPIRFSPTLRHLRQVFPSRRADLSPYEHPMTEREVVTISEAFKAVVAERRFGLPSVPASFLIARLLDWFPMFNNFATVMVRKLEK